MEERGFMASWKGGNGDFFPTLLEALRDGFEKSRAREIIVREVVRGPEGIIIAPFGGVKLTCSRQVAKSMIEEGGKGK
jgi:hypothetical protein